MKFNHSPRFRYFLASFLAAVLAISASAQEKTPARVRVKIDLISLGENIDGLTIGRDKGRKPVTAYAFRYKTTVTYSGARVMEISRTAGSPKVVEPGPHDIVPLPIQKLPQTEVDQTDKFAKAIAKRREKNPNLVALAVLPAGAKRLTVLLTPASNNTFRAYVINDDPTKLPKGQMRIHNFCEHPISMRFNNAKPIVLRSQKSHQCQPKANGQLIYHLAYPKNKKWKIQENNIIRIPKQEQVQMLVLRSNSSFFSSASGARGGVLQVAILRRNYTVGRKPKGQEKEKPPLPVAPPR